MKNSKDYSKKISTLYNSLKRKHAKVPEVSYSQIVDALIYGIISEKLSEKETEAAIKRFNEYFVDWNDLRVSRPEEISEMLGCDNAENRQIALTLTKVLNKIFNENHQVNIEGLHKLGKRPARQKLEKMEELSRFAIDYCMLTALASHAIPLTENMIEYLKNNDLVDLGADAQTIEGFLAKQISAKNGYEFYKLLRHESETDKSKLLAVAHRTKKNVVSTMEQTPKTKTKTKKVKKVKKETAAKTKRKK